MSRAPELTATAIRRLPKHRQLAHGRRERFRMGALATLVSQIIGTAGQLLLVPIFLAYWGQGRYGEWLTLAAATAYLAVLDFGVQMYVVNRLNACYTRGEMGMYTRVLHSALYFSLLLSTLAFALVGVTASLFPIAESFGFRHTGEGASTLIVALLALQVIAAVPQGLIRGVYRTVGEYPRGTMVANTQRLAVVGLTAAAIVSGGGLVGVAAIQLVPLIGVVVFVVADLRRRHPEIEIGFRERDLRLAARFLGPSFLFFLLQAAMVTGLQGSTVLVSVSLGAGSVALFATTRTLANSIRQVSSVLTNALWPELTMLQAQGRHQTMQKVHKLSVKVVTLLSLAAALFLYHAGPDVFSLWTHGVLDYDNALLRAFVITLVVQTPWMTSMFVLISSNHHQHLAILWFCATIVGLGAGALLLPSLGLPGLVYSICIAELLLCGCYVPWASCRLIQQPLGAFAWDVLGRGALVCVGITILANRVLESAPALQRVPSILATGVFAVVVAFGLGYALWLNSTERQHVQSLLRRTPDTP